MNNPRIHSTKKWTFILKMNTEIAAFKLNSSLKVHRFWLSFFESKIARASKAAEINSKAAKKRLLTIN